jgi:hypothetical protein
MDWYAVRHVVANGNLFEERVTLWRAASAEKAIAQAEKEVAAYTATVGGQALDMFQSYQLADEPADGAEVFSLIRRSEPSPESYLDAFFDTGEEHQQVVPAD